MLDFAAKGSLEDTTMWTAMQKLFGTDNMVVMINPTTVSITRNDSIRTDRDALRVALNEVSSQRILIPINCSGNHWCAIIVNSATDEILLYDPMHSSYMASIRAVAGSLVSLLPGAGVKRYRTRLYESSLGIQTDSYNCGVYVLLVFEMLCGANAVGAVDKKMLQCLRYRYLCMCL